MLHLIAVASARELICEQIKGGFLSPDHYIVVADEHGIELSRVEFRGAFTIKDRMMDGSRGVGGGELPD